MVLIGASVQASHAVTIVILSLPPPSITIQVGTAGGTVDEVSFTVPATSVGVGTPVTGAPVIRIEVMARDVIPDSKTATLSVDSSTPLSNGTSTIPFTDISWTTSDPDIPAGTFNGSTQNIMSFQNSRQIFNDHTFQYANTKVLEAGEYTGRVTYTLTMP